MPRSEARANRFWVGKKLNGVFQRGWLYDGIHPIAEFDGSGAVVARFAYGSQGNVPDLIWKAGTLYRVLSDERGSPRLVVNAVTGLVAQRLDYDVWGNVVADTTPGFQPFGFAGGLYDPDTKLIRFGARDYDPETGRWTAKDAVRFQGGFNLYLYSGNDPISRIDPSGEFALAIAGAFIGAGVNGLYAWQTGGDVTNAILIGAGVGFVTGLIPIPWLSGALFGAGTTLANRFAVNCENTLPWYVDVGINALAGAAGGQLGEILGKASVTTTIAASDAAGDLGALIGGAASGVWTADLLQANDLLDALKQ